MFTTHSIQACMWVFYAHFAMIVPKFSHTDVTASSRTQTPHAGDASSSQEQSWFFAMFMLLVGVESTSFVDSLHIESPEKTSLATIQRKPLLAPAYSSARVSMPPQTRTHVWKGKSTCVAGVLSVQYFLISCRRIIKEQ